MLIAEELEPPMHAKHGKLESGMHDCPLMEQKRDPPFVHSLPRHDVPMVDVVLELDPAEVELFTSQSQGYWMQKETDIEEELETFE